MASVDFSGKWKFQKGENMEALLDTMNVAEPMRTAILKASPIMEISQNGDEFSNVSKSDSHTFELKFKTGEKFLYKNQLFEGREMNMIATWESNKQVLTNVDNPDDLKITRELQGDKLVMTQTKGDVTARRIYTRC